MLRVFRLFECSKTFTKWVSCAMGSMVLNKFAFHGTTRFGGFELLVPIVVSINWMRTRFDFGYQLWNQILLRIRTQNMFLVLLMCGFITSVKVLWKKQLLRKKGTRITGPGTRFSTPFMCQIITLIYLFLELGLEVLKEPANTGFYS
jgi:hypothetical protein